MSYHEVKHYILTAHYESTDSREKDCLLGLSYVQTLLQKADRLVQSL